VVTPYGGLQVYAAASDKDLLLFLERNWTELWKAMKPRLEEMCNFYEVSDHLKQPDWTGAIQRMEPHVYMGDKADFLFSFRLGETRPEWDFFLKGITIVHSQPIH
jgi:hypothetical protein